MVTQWGRLWCRYGMLRAGTRARDIERGPYGDRRRTTVLLKAPGHESRGLELPPRLIRTLGNLVFDVAEALVLLGLQGGPSPQCLKGAQFIGTPERWRSAF